MGFCEMYRAQREDLPISLTSSQCKGKTFIVTGSNTGLGYECAKHLVSMNSARVIMAVRNLSSGDAAKTKIEQDTGKTGVIQVWHMDMASFESTRKFAERVINELDRVDGVVQNAGVAGGDWREAEGHEQIITVNVLSNMLLTVMLLPYLEKVGNKFSIRPRITIIGSNVAFLPQCEKALKKLGPGDVFDDLADRKKWEVDVADFYPISKTLLWLSVQKLAALTPVERTETSVIVNYTNPGICYTDLSRDANFALNMQIIIGRMIMGRTAEMGSRTLIGGIAAGKASHGKYLSECVVKDKWVPSWGNIETMDPELAGRIWDNLVERLEKIVPGCVGAATLK